MARKYDRPSLARGYSTTSGHEHAARRASMWNLMDGCGDALSLALRCLRSEDGNQRLDVTAAIQEITPDLPLFACSVCRIVNL